MAKLNREDYNACISTALKGKQLGKDERKLEFCVASKLCSGKAATREEATQVCSVPKLPKWARGLTKEDEENVSCADRMRRSVNNIDVINLKLRSGEAEEVRGAAAQIMADIFSCNPNEGTLAFLTEVMDDFNGLSKRFYLKGEGKDLEKNLNLLKEMLS